MAVPDTAQALVGTFSLGVLLAASSASLVLFAWKHAAKALRDGLRLALISFLALSSAWALTGFITTAANPQSRSACQVAVVFSTLFDQFARFSVEQFLLWAAPVEGAPKALQIGSQVLLLARLVLGVAYVGLIRPTFDPTCVPRASIPYLAVVLIITDAVIVVLLAIKAISSGASSSNLSTRSAKQSKSVFLSIAGLAIWMGMSVTYLLGFEQIDFVFRSAIPAAGQLILILILTLFSGLLFAEHDASRLGSSSRSTPSSSRSVEAPPVNYEDLKRDNLQNVPRFISRNADGTFPPISRPLANEDYAASAIPTQQAYTGPIAELDGTRSKSPWGRFFSGNERSEAPRMPPGQFKISGPILHDDPNDEHNPLRRIQTIDLATAMEQDRERRLQRAATSPGLIATRPAPSPPRPSTASAALSRGQPGLAIKKKPLRATAPPGALSPEPSEMPVLRSRLDVESQAASSSMQLSPGVEAMRRRSPRYPESRPVTQNMATTPTSARLTNLREEVPEVPPLPPFKFSNTPHAPGKGLPSNPRAGPRVAPAPPVPAENSTAVMLVTEIVYKDPDMVRNVLHKKAKSAPILAKPMGSVVHRPRPIPRNQADRQVFPAEATLNRGHRRSLSSGSLITGKSILYVDPGNPKMLPPLPEPPKTADSVRFPTGSAVDSQRTSDRPPQSRRASAVQDRKSVVEDLRRAQDRLRLNQKASTGDSGFANKRVSAATTKASIRTMSIFGLEENHSHQYQQRQEQVEQPEQANEDDASTIGPATAKEVDGDNESWRRQTQSDGRSSTFTSRSQRKSSPVIPDFQNLTFSPTGSIPATATTPWEMPAAMHMPVSKHQAHSTYIGKDKPGSPAHTVSDGNVCEAVITVMLDDGPAASVEETILTAKARPQSVVEEATPVQTPTPALETLMPTRFHRKIGDECLSFSARKSAVLKKRVPPPPPLPLSMRTRPMIIQTAEPSPLESPEEAYRLIQQQLDNLDRPDARAEDNEDQEIALLADLEAEMGLQENRWQDLHNNMDRGSISTFASTPDIQSRPASSVARSSIRSSQGDLAGVYGAFLQPGRANAQMPARGSNLANSLEYLRGNNKERLSQAEWYLQNSAQLSSKSAGTTMTRLTMAEIGSPSPPDTNESDFEVDFAEELELDSPVSMQDFPVVPATTKLWRPRHNVHQVSNEPLWAAPVQMPRSPDLFASLGDIPIYVRTRRTFEEPLFVDSFRLWVKPVATRNIPAGLWQKAQPLVIRSQIRAKALPPRPLTVRPPRRQKRISQLADILESPKPLPNKRGTLGFFQFPWGEQSEHPVVFQRPGRLTAMPGTMSTGTSPLSAILEARARQLAAQEQAMQDLTSQSQTQNQNVTTPGDDEFDENTLWEIANLLRADHIPSRDSLFPSLDDYENEDDDFDMDAYAAEMLSDDGEDDSEEMETDESEDDELPYSFEIVSGSPVSVVSSIHSLSGTEPEPSLLWDKTSGLYHKSGGFGLEQPSEDQWSSYAQDASERPIFRHLNEPAIEIESASLWATAVTQSPATSQSSSLWTKPLPALPEATKPQTAATSVQTSVFASLWAASDASESSQKFGLAQPQAAKWEAYTDKTTERPTFRHLNEQLTTVESRSLWTSTQTKVMSSSKQSLLWSSAASKIVSPVKASLWNSAVRSATEPIRAHGLPQPEKIEWQSYVNNDKARPTFRQQSGEIDLLQSNSLWGLPESQPLCEEPASFLWGQTAVTEPATQSSPSAPTALWTKVAAVKPAETSKWLFNLAHNGKDRKRTSREVISVSGVRAVPQRNEPLAQLQTTSLWTKEVAQHEPTGPWMTVKPKVAVATRAVVATKPVVQSVAAPVAVSKSVPATLWVKNIVGTQATTETGLWSFRQVAAASSQTAHLEVMPIDLARKPRVPQEPLPAISSSQLWTSPLKKPARRSTWLGFAAVHRPASGHIAYTQLWSMPNSQQSSKPKSELKTVWTRSIVQPSRVQSFAGDDFFNHFSAPSRPQTMVFENQPIAEEEEELPPKPSNSNWLSTWGWKKSD
ncbi:uncharacterized protein B0I36DRAFT_357608 [Microdochium trichocladiopsis]|uniref:Uncharacterized protein n=1 Tax=Microdochium trichocladiopsis TaxID=1682393 RepID=A0A9P9BW01_9PEZI|nr:uncharacterized protein B0I36DRAFT_357608 [Microdochium trichocladiopsis]KAH7040287.1 hypothetical protein B0I36DRAFT_357608 [Microdochium trichocladiopsis]